MKRSEEDKFFRQIQAHQRMRVDHLILELWQSFEHLNALYKSALTEHDADLWSAVVLHPAIQNRLREEFDADSVELVRTKP